MPRVSTDSTPFLEGVVMKVVHYQIGKRYIYGSSGFNSANPQIRQILILTKSTWIDPWFFIRFFR
jgi:hypothetical protein